MSWNATLKCRAWGSLYQDLTTYPKWSVKHEQHPTAPQFATHEVEILPDTLLHQLLPDTYLVNSYHHQALKELAPSLKATAFSPDGLVEGIESLDKDVRLFGVQWHPELTHSSNSTDQGLFDFFVQEF